MTRRSRRALKGYAQLLGVVLLSSVCGATSHHVSHLMEWVQATPTERLVDLESRVFELEAQSARDEQDVENFRRTLHEVCADLYPEANHRAGGSMETGRPR